MESSQALGYINLALVLFKFIIYGNSWPDSRGGNTKLSSYSSYL